jgi:hypothetical protein
MSQMSLTATSGKKLTTGLGWWRRHEADDGSGMVEHLGGGAYRNLMRRYPDAGRAVVMFGNLTSYPVEQLIAAALGSGTGPGTAPAGQ